MNKEEIIAELQTHYGSFVDYIEGLTEAELAFAAEGKWSAHQQLTHIVLCVKPLAQVYSMPEQMIEQTFGKTSRANQSYEDILREYKSKLEEGGSAPKQYIPDPAKEKAAPELIASLKRHISNLSDKVQLMDEGTLESLQIPHPLLKKITLKEMLYNAIYHVQHHQRQANEVLSKMQ